MSKRQEQIDFATKRGYEGFHSGKPHGAPALDNVVLEMLKGRQVGETPEGEASTIEILTAYSDGFERERQIAVGMAEGPCTAAA